MTLCGITNDGLAFILSADEKVFSSRFEPSRTTNWTIVHHIVIQLARFVTEKTGATNWINIDRSTFPNQCKKFSALEVLIKMTNRNIKIQQSAPHSEESQLLVEKLSAELAFITGDNGKSHFNAQELNNECCLWVLARNEAGNAVGCGALRSLGNNTAEVKRMYSDRSVPGVGSALLEYLETRAKSMGYREIRLSTRVINSRAVAFYYRSGYAQIQNYEPYIGRNESICFAKTL